MRLRQDITVLNSRSLDQTPEFTRKLQKIGVRVVEIPVLEIVPLELSKRSLDTLRTLSASDYIALTSSNAVRSLELQLAREPGLLKDVKFAVVGEATNAFLEKLGFTGSVIPKDPTAAALGEALLALAEYSQAKVLFLKGDSAGPGLSYALRNLGERYLEATIYSSRESSLLKERLRSEDLAQLDILTFMSSNSATAFFENVSEDLREGLLQRPIVAVGPMTGRALEELGASNISVSKDRSVDGVVETILQLIG